MRLTHFALLIAVLAMPSLACAESPAEPEADRFEGLFAIAYGNMIFGEPVFEEKGNTLFVGGTDSDGMYVYKVKPECVEDRSTGTTRIIREATSYACATSISERQDRLVDFLKPFIGDEVEYVITYDRNQAIRWTKEDGEIKSQSFASDPVDPKVKFRDKPLERHIIFSDERQADERDPDFDEIIQQFLDYYHHEVWVIWGTTYEVYSPWQRHAGNKLVMDSVLRGEPVSDSLRNQTLFRNADIYNDFVRQNGR